MKALNAQQSRELEQRAQQQGCPLLQLMEQAGAAVARFFKKKYEMEQKRVVVLCGRGNNGGDGFVAARYLAENKARVVVLLVDGQPATENAAAMYRRLYEQPAVRVFSYSDDRELAFSLLETADFIIDAVYGIGFHGRVAAHMEPLFEQVSKAAAVVVAVDIPSGLLCDTGTMEGLCIRADYTVSFSTLKCAHILNPGKELCGEVSVAPIGISAALIEQQAAAVQVTEMADVVRAIKPREPESHKGSFGRLLCICGSTGMAGAAAMSISAALRCGVGLVDAALPRDIYPVVATQAQEAVYTLLDILPEGKYSVESRRSLEKSSSLCSAILLGCGLGVAPHTKALVEEVISGSRVPVILDADGINSILGHIDILKTTDVPLILTPHPGEMSRLMGKTVSEIQQNRVRYARQFAMDYAVTLVLKGAGTVIAAPDGSIWLNRTGNAGMAKGGSGDVLAGMLASFTAQGIPATAAAAVAVYLHGLAGDRCAAQLSQTAMLPTDLIAMLPKLFLEIGR